MSNFDKMKEILEKQKQQQQKRTFTQQNHPN